ncbi:hypothetical protein SAMN05192555_10323 [Franzmannia pantelleriensis]|uniref:Copper(I)-binding protein n=1 Tax=Franzmannia pantelleriensis TaxID=48727 RepID=A0A1G9HZI3_9GAMM|nr:copper chaperone PCu(A)C [Halomonas pantelleriensis]SDL18378.1 hypothetical protein SAMN05192555_10323 [Halomonas pantelleriensis]
MIARSASLISALLLGGALLPSLASAHDFTLDDIRIAHPFATPTPPGAPNGAAYLDITAGDEPAELVGASSPISAVVEIHDMIMDDGNMQMRKLDAIDVEAGETVTMRPGGGYHLMLLGLEDTLVEGESFPLTLEFAEQGEIEVEVWVQEANEGGEAADGHHHHDH